MRIGLISDTHMPHRWKALPPKIFELFSTCEVILHAGDVGKLWVLDQLSQAAPVIAVHGNDETDEATAALPFLQTLAFEGHRVVMTHSHYPDHATEMEKRKDDSWTPKLQYRADFGKAHSAKIVITGHTHIPMQVTHDDVLLINPGAIACGSAWTKQTLQTIAVMTLERDSAPDIQFFHINSGDVYVPDVDWNAGFIAAMHNTCESITADDLAAVRGWLMKTVYPHYTLYMEEMIYPLCHEIWAGNRDDLLTLEEVVRALKGDNSAG